MRISVLAVVAAISAATLAVPAAVAVAVGCVDAGDAALVSGPPAGFMLGWTPDCVVVADGGSVTFVQGDALPHRPQAIGCFDMPLLPSVARSVRLDLQEGLFYANDVECRPEAVSQRTGSGIGEGTGPSEPVLEFLDGEVRVHYICSIHGPIMHGVIRVIVATGEA